MSNSVVVLQARTNSSRLPAKVLLPIKGIPLVVLAAKRAANTGRKVVVATSQESSDDALATVLEQHDLECFRGSLDNTLERIVKALNIYADETIVFRLTADNVFPDGALLDEIEAEFLERELGYLCCNGVQSGLPYGVSAEVMCLGSLREALKNSTNAYDQEHVTPSIIRKYGEQYFKKYSGLNKGNYRCTVDAIDDYFAITKVFEDVGDPVSVSFLDLVMNFEVLPYVPSAKIPLTKLVFGAAQLGMDYGIANQSGQPSQKLSTQLLRTAISNGAGYIDTAHAYGNSEKVVGTALVDGWNSRAKVVTKLSPLLDCPRSAENSTLKAFVDASVYKSCSMFGVQNLDVLMLHRVSHLTDWNGFVWKYLLELKELGVINSLGVSTQTPEEVDKALSVDGISFIQMPFNLLDWRWDTVIPKILSIKSNRDLTIHIRSAFLQGLLLCDDANSWISANVDEHKKIRDWLDAKVLSCNRINRADLCLNYINSMDWVDGIAVGMETLEQLDENMRYFEKSALTTVEAQALIKSRPKLKEETLNPSLWRGV